MSRNPPFWLIVSLLFAATPARPSLAISRDRVMANAAAYAEHRWTCTAANTRVDCSASWSSDYAPGEYVGPPYDWGGYETLPEFEADLAAGQGAGSHSRHGALECTTGVDCSGYVSQVWETAHRSTNGIPEVCDRVAVDEILRADAFDEVGSHVVLFARRAANGNPVFYEASGSASKVRLNTGATWSTLDGYVPLRYRYISDEPDPAGPGTLAQPIRIERFPYDHDFDTTNSRSLLLDRYSCAIHTFEAGPEVVYAFDAASAGRLQASVSDGADVDVDLHLLGAPDEDHCLVRHDTDLGFDLPGPGTYYLVADSWTNADGVDFPGPYHLHAEFSGELVSAGQPDAGGGEPQGEDAGLLAPEPDLGPLGPQGDAGAPPKDLGPRPADDAGDRGTDGATHLDAGVPVDGGLGAPRRPTASAQDTREVGCRAAVGPPATQSLLGLVLLSPLLLLFLLLRRRAVACRVASSSASGPRRTTA